MNCRDIILAHHCDDQVETCLFNLCRGAGMSGLTGMEPKSIRIVDDVELHIYRPFLSVRRDELDIYIKNNSIIVKKSYEEKLKSSQRKLDQI